MTTFNASLLDAQRKIRKARGLSQDAFSDVSIRIYLSFLDDCLNVLRRIISKSYARYYNIIH